jgi:hypothetical protein
VEFLVAPSDFIGVLGEQLLLSKSGSHKVAKGFRLKENRFHHENTRERKHEKKREKSFRDLVFKFLCFLRVFVRKISFWTGMNKTVNRTGKGWLWKRGQFP